LGQITTLSIDLGNALRKRKPAKHTSQLRPRARARLVDWTTLMGAGPSVLLLDTNVYISRAAGRLPATLRELIDQSLLFHCSVVLAELAVGVANADPSRPGWPALRDHYVALFAAIPASRLVTPDAQTWTDASVIAGTLARTQGFQTHQRKECLNDVLIFLTAAKAGVTVLTANRDEFDLIQQLAPTGRFVHY
jgi:predicted nucleic acid-binding protein